MPTLLMKNIGSESSRKKSKSEKKGNENETALLYSPAIDDWLAIGSSLDHLPSWDFTTTAAEYGGNVSTRIYLETGNILLLQPLALLTPSAIYREETDAEQVSTCRVH